MVTLSKGWGLADASLGVGLLDREVAGPVVVEVGSEDVAQEVVDEGGVMAGNVVVAEVAPDHRGILALDQGVVVAASRAGLGELLDMELVQQRGDPVVDVLGAVVGVETPDDKGESLDRPLKGRNQKTLRNAFCGGHKLVLRDLVHEVDLVQTLLPVEVALVDGIHSQKARPSGRMGLSPLSDAHLRRPGPGHRQPAPAVGDRLAKTVQMAVGESWG